MLINLFRSEVLKLKRSFIFMLIILSSIFSPLISFLLCISKPQTFASIFKTDKDPWLALVNFNWNNSASFLLPMFIILITSLIAQIEYRNNTWKQINTLPIPFLPIYLTKFLIIVILILISFLLFNVFLILCGLVVNIIYPEFPFLNMPISWYYILITSCNIFLSILALSAFQYCMSMRFKNYILPIATGFVLIIAGLILKNGWDGIIYFPHSYPGLAFAAIVNFDDESTHRIILNSIVFTFLFLTIGYFLMILKRDKSV